MDFDHNYSLDEIRTTYRPLVQMWLSKHDENHKMSVLIKFNR